MRTITLNSSTLYYHVNQPGLPAGHVIEPGRYGSNLINAGLSKQNDELLEQAREDFRAEHCDHLPSRLSSIFFCETKEQATYYRDNAPLRKDDSVYSVRVIDATVTACHSIWSMTPPDASNPLTEQMATAFPQEYWNNTYTSADTMEIFAVTELEIVAFIA